MGWEDRSRGKLFSRAREGLLPGRGGVLSFRYVQRIYIACVKINKFHSCSIREFFLFYLECAPKLKEIAVYSGKFRSGAHFSVGYTCTHSGLEART